MMRNSLRTDAIIPVVALVCGALVTWPLVAGWHGDLNLYADYADKLLHGLMPYRDFALEYPPLALVSFVGPRLLVLGAALSDAQYRWMFLMQSALLLWCITHISQQLVPLERRRSVSFVLGAMVILLSPFLAWRFDLFPALLTVLALLAASQHRWTLTGVWLGLSIAAKLYPVVLGPVFVLSAYLATTSASRTREAVWSALQLVAGCGATLCATVLPFYVIAPAGLLNFLKYHQLRGEQIESVAGGLISLAGLAGLTSGASAYNFGAQHLVSPWAAAVLPWHTPFLILLYVLLFGIGIRQLWVHRALAVSKQQATDWMAAMICSALLVFILASKVFSPQYLLWLLPFVPLLPRVAPRIVGLLICAFTVVIFPFFYYQLVIARPWAVTLLNMRNFASVFLLGLSIAAVRRLTGGRDSNGVATDGARPLG